MPPETPSATPVDCVLIISHQPSYRAQLHHVSDTCVKEERNIYCSKWVHFYVDEQLLLCNRSSCESLSGGPNKAQQTGMGAHNAALREATVKPGVEKPEQGETKVVEGEINLHNR